jgi:hypothetical protein
MKVQAAFTDFVRHLESYLPLFRQLSEFRLVYVSRTDSHFGKATEIFSSLVKIPLESDIARRSASLLPRAQSLGRKTVRSAVTDADLIFRNHARARFAGERFEGLYRGWKNGRVSEFGHPAGAWNERLGSAALASIRFCCNGLGRSRIQRIPSEEGKNYALHFLKLTLLHPETDPKSLETGEIRNRGKRKSPWKKRQIGRERPHFFGFQPPKKFVGSLPPCGTVNRAGRFFHGDREFGRNTHHQRRNSMPLVKKAPGIMTREVRLEEPVNELLEDYARFIESNADHVINAVLKKVLWRDQDYRKWREARRTAQLGPDKAQPTEARGRA